MSATPSSSPFSDLEPALVWSHFATLCRIPHGSKHEAALVAALKTWAAQRGLETHIDTGGNLLIRKPASKGCENAPTVTLQAHLDMVCQKNSNVDHDFERDPIRPVVQGNLLLAPDTTLGADNGIGVALALAAMEDASLVHGPLEALLTVDEEAGMSGAHNLPTDTLQGQYLLNLDTEKWGGFFVGCAGGMDVNVSRPVTPERLPPGWHAMRLDVAGLRGGHSGININEGRGNAIKILARILCALEAQMPLRLAALNGGTARNALPREAHAIIAIPPEQVHALQAAIAAWQKTIRAELQDVDDNVNLAVAPAQANQVLPQAEQATWLHTLHAAPHGVRRMCVDMPGNVETSNNLGMVDVHPDVGSCNFMVRSTLDSACHALADEIASLFKLSGIAVEQSGYYPGWTPNLKSPLLALCQAVYARTFGDPSDIHIIHAGLECGIIGAKYPKMDIVSFGPTIHSPHAPSESVEIDTVAKCWTLLKAILEQTAQAPAAFC